MNTPYFEWLLSLINGSNYDGMEYRKALWQLYSTPFYAIDPMDQNREIDGESLRQSFTGLDNFPARCSVLELMIALSQRCEIIMRDSSELPIGVDHWFWSMFNNLELSNMDDAHYDPYYIEYVTCRLISRDYGPNGEGGLFYVQHPAADMRTAQIWYQMNWYLDDILQ